MFADSMTHQKQQTVTAMTQKGKKNERYNQPTGGD